MSVNSFEDMLSRFPNNFNHYEHSEEEEHNEVDNIPKARFHSVQVLEPSHLMNSFCVVENGCELSVLNNVELGLSEPLFTHRVEFRKLEEASSLTMAFTSPVVAASCSNQLIAIACADFTVHVHDCSGSLVMMPFVISATCVQIHCRDQVVMIVTVEMTVSAWNMQKKCAIMVNYQLASLFQSSSVYLKAAYISEADELIVVDSDLKTYAFNSDYKTWVLVREPSWGFADFVLPNSAPLTSGVIHESCSFSINEATGSANMCGADNKLRSIDPSVHSVAQSITQQISWKHCQMEEKMALDLGLASEFEEWFLKCATKLGFVGLEEDLRRKLDELVIDESPDTNREEFPEPDFVSKLGLNRTELLRNTLNNLEKNLHTQEVCNVYNNILKHL